MRHNTGQQQQTEIEVGILREVQHFSAPQHCLGYYWVTVVTTRAALRQIRVEILIGSQAEFEITN